ncbi:MAG: stage IV sporulation protein A [Clostridia bacterium]|nr:stage IV sporulation protein A [Clostridia bacterium]
MEKFQVYEEIASRTGGEIFIGVVGPVRTGKSTFINRFMREFVLPGVTGNKKKRYTDELPQSAAGKTVMTTEPKFVPEEAAEIKVKDAVARVRLVDCVGYPVEGAAGFEEEGAPRLVKTPWQDAPVPFEAAAEEGTRRVIHDHSTIGILMTTDGSVTGLERSAYERAEEKAYAELNEMGKPFVILLNCARPSEAEELRAQLQEKYSAPVIAVNAEEMTQEEISAVLERILYEFPVLSIDVDLPDWMRVLDADSPLVSEVLGELRNVSPKICKMSDCALLDTLFAESERLMPPAKLEIDAATGRARCKVTAKEGAFYEVLSEQCGQKIDNDFALMSFVSELAQAKKVYARVGQAFADAQEFGYGIVPPEEEEMNLSEPTLVKKSGRVGVNLRADAPSYHIIRVDVSGEVHPALGNKEQSEAFVKQIADDMENQPDRAWNTNMFGRTLKEMLGEELFVKNRSMRDNVRKKMRRTVTRIVNEGKGGVICILL